MNSPTLFQYCQKLIVLSEDATKVLLARRKGEADYNGVYSFIGGKMETTDESVIAGMKREKDEEIGPDVTVTVLPNESYNLLFRKKDGNAMIVAHIVSSFVSGTIALSEEYDDYTWVSINGLESFEPKIANIPELTRWAKTKLTAAPPTDFVEI